jgi:hypothetical protein
MKNFLKKEGQKKDKTSLSDTSKNVTVLPLRGDALFASLRRLEARVKSLEAQASTLRRDVNRIDKKVYRAAQDAPAAETQKPGNGGGMYPLPDPYVGRY